MDITQVPAGYKLTDLGLLPEDWEVKQIGELIKFEGGSQPVKSTFSVAQKPGYIRLIQIRDYKTDDFAIYIPAELARKTCTQDDVMIGRYGPPVFQILGGIEGAYNVALIKSVPNEKISREYWRLTVSQEPLFHFIDGLSRRSSGQTGVDMVELKKYLIALPPPAEQQAIAAALGEMDALLAAQRARLAKQRAVKQGLLENLLTGKQRLPGFSAEWKSKRLGDIANMFSGGTPSTSNAAFYGGNIPWITSTDLNRSRIKEVSGRITEQGLKLSSAKMVRPNTLLIALYGATAGVTAITEIGAAINQAVLAIEPTFDSNEFLFYQLTRLKNHIINTYTQGGQPNLSGAIVKAITMPVPSVDEQRAIAAVLSEADAYLAALEAEHAKTQLLKQGMMQNLLTGKLRLV